MTIYGSPGVSLTAVISGGVFEGPGNGLHLVGATVNLTGGQFLAGPPGSVYADFLLDGNSVLNIFGTGLAFDSFGILHGTLLDGTPIQNYRIEPFLNAAVNLINVPEPSDGMLVALGLAGCAVWGWQTRKRNA